MPRISYFYGITIWMYRPDHPPAHFHAQYGEHWAQISIADQQVLNGSLPPRALRLVTDWAKLHTAASKPTGISPRRLRRLSRSIRCPKMSDMTIRVTTVEPLDDHNLRLTFSDGLVRDFDASPLMYGPLGEPLRDPDYFRQVRIDEEARTIVWPNGLDPDPDVLHGDFEAVVVGRSAAHA